MGKTPSWLNLITQQFEIPYEFPMPDQLSVDDITALLLDIHQEEYPDSIPPKALHKILYFAKKELDREHVDVDIPMYWYMYGALVKTGDSTISTVQTDQGKRIQCGIEPNKIEAPETTLQKSRRALSTSLEKYYDQGLEPLTDDMYNDAPYEVQRTYRELDKQLTVAADPEQSTLYGPKNEEPVRNSVFQLVKDFPVHEFPEYESDLYTWYRLVMAEIDSLDFNPEVAFNLTKKFWRLFGLELACRENTGLNRDEIAEERDVSSIEDANADIRADFTRLNDRHVNEYSSESEFAIKAAEAFMLPHLQDIVSV